MTTINAAALNGYRNLTLQGVKLDEKAKLEKPNNGISSFEFFKKDAQGRISPALCTKYDPRATDPSPLDQYLKLDSATEARLKRDPSEFARLLDQALATHKRHLFPAQRDLSSLKTKAQFNYVVGRRVTKFLKEATATAKKLYTGDALNTALKAVDDADRKLWDRTIDFDEGDELRMSTYGPYDQTQVNFFKELLKKYESIDTRLLSPEAKESVERAKKQAQRKVDVLMRDQWVQNTSSFNSADGEAQKGAVLIDSVSRQRISVKDGTETSLTPRYVIMNVTEGGQDKAVFYDHQRKKYYFDGSQTEVPAALVGKIRTTALPEGAEEDYRITARELQPGEHLRKNFPFDQTREGEISTRTVDWLAWAGLCHNQALSEANGAVVPKSDPGHTEYNADADREFHFTPDLLNEPLLVVPDLGTQMQRGAQTRVLGESRVGGARYNEEPGRLSFGAFTVPRDRNRRDAFLFEAIIKPDGTRVSSAEYFRERFAVKKSDRGAAYELEPNPNFIRTLPSPKEDSVEAKLDDCVIEASVELERYGADGYLERTPRRLVLDLKQKPDKDVVVDSYRTASSSRSYEEVSVNLAKRTVTKERFKMEADPTSPGKFVKKSDGKVSLPLDLSDITGVREGNVDAPASYVPLLQRAAETGEAVVFESASNYEIWNSRLDSLKSTTRHADAENVTQEYELDSKFGDGSAKIVYDRTKNGARRNFTGIDQRGDFFWNRHHDFVAFDGGWLNSGALAEGLVEANGGTPRADMLADMSEILQAAFGGTHHWSIVRDGVRYLYDDESKWRQDVGALKAQRAKVFQDRPTTEGLRFTRSETLRQGESKRYSITVPKDGDVRFKLDGTGDIDIYVKKNGRALTSSSDWRDEGTTTSATGGLAAKAGDKLDVLLYAFTAGTANLDVSQA